jgi:hypothetical protein
VDSEHAVPNFRGKKTPLAFKHNRSQTITHHLKIFKRQHSYFLNPKLTKCMGFWERHVHAPVIIHLNIQVTSNIYVQNITQLVSQ